MSGGLNLPADGLNVGSNQLVAANGKVGVGKTPVDYLLEVQGDTHASGCVRFGSVEAFCDGGITTISAGSNAVMAPSFEYPAPRTRYWSVKGSEFIPFDETFTYSKSVNMGLSGSTGIFGAPVHLPHGATVTGMTLYAYDNSADDFNLRLDRTDLLTQTVYVMAKVSTTGASTTVTAYSTTSITALIINNNQYGYALFVYSMDGTLNHELSGAVISYTVSEAIP